MAPLFNRRVTIFLVVCFILLIAAITLIVAINLPGDETVEPSLSPTPRAHNQRISPSELLPTVQGESGFDEQEIQQYQESSKRAAEAYQNRLQKMPFITKLPHTTTRYKIEITAVSDTVYITTYGPPSFQAKNREEALSWIRLNGGNPETITIQYRN